MNKLISIIIAVLSCFLFLSEAQADDKLINIYFFYSNSCSHCHEEEKFLADLEQDNKRLKVYHYEVHTAENKQLLNIVSDLYDLKGTAVPVTIIADTAYVGYMKEKSDLWFFKTIKYYEKYGYHDRVGKLLKEEISSTEEEYMDSTSTDYIPILDDNVPSLEEFLDTYSNYQIIGPIYTDNLDTSTIALILGLLSPINIISLLSSIIILICLTKINDTKNKILLLMYYLSSAILLSTGYLINNNLFKLIIHIVLLILFLVYLWKYYQKKKSLYMLVGISLMLVIIAKAIENSFLSKYKLIFGDILDLYQLSGLDKLLYYFNYLFMVVIINILLIVLIYILINKIKRKKFSLKKVS